ncbi:recombinase family protein [Krasilnikovia sp. MM14-A1004]|uniref:recombinase family protein n=1 Tax=Krasilnikovia sp. MM14-A1004 TaxID=3373541 RepID=UPI00399CF98E
MPSQRHDPYKLAQQRRRERAAVDRNPHRTGEAWHLRTVAAILANPNNTGRQVWNRQHTHLRRTDDVAPGVAGLRKLTPSP